MSIPAKEKLIAVIVTDATPTRSAWDLLFGDTPEEFQKAPRLQTPAGFIMFISALDVPEDHSPYDGLSSQPFPGVQVQMRIGKPALALWSWAQQFGNNYRN
jgi:hypothetical protein